MQQYLGVKFPLPKPLAPVAARELPVTVNGTARVITLPGAAVSSDEILFADSDNYTVTLTDIDANGNRSHASNPLHGSIDDDMRPAKPGDLGPLALGDKRLMTDAEAKAAQDLAAKKTAQDLKAAQDKSLADAKAEEARVAAHAKIDADAKAAKDAADAKKPVPAPPVK